MNRARFRRGIAALACLGALALAMIVVPAMHAEVHAREHEAEVAAAAPRAIPRAPGGRPVIRVTHAVSIEIEPRGAHSHGPGHTHTHDGDRPGHHGDAAPEHLAFAIAASAPPIVPPPFVDTITLGAVAAPAPLAGSVPLETHRSRGPPDVA